MAERKIGSGLKMALDLGPVVAFFVVYLLMKDRTVTVAGVEYHGFIVATALFVPMLLASTGALWALTGRISTMQVLTLVLVVVMGGLSVWLNDERFFKMKPTIIYLVFAAILGFGLWRGESYLKVVIGEVLPMQEAGWIILTRRVTWFFVGLAVLNEVVWRGFSTQAWVGFKTFGLTAALFAFFMTQGRLMQRYALKSPDKDA